MRKKYLIGIAVLLIILSIIGILLFTHKTLPRRVTFFVEFDGRWRTEHQAEENISIVEAIKQAGYTLSDETFVFPQRDALLSAGTHITIHSAKEVTIHDRESTRTYQTSALTVGDALAQGEIVLFGADFVKPSLETALTEGMNVQVTRVTVTEETEDVSIPFKKVEKEDDTISFRIKKVTQKGETGIRTLRYKVSRYNNEVVAKEKIAEEITKEPTEEITTVGTKVTVVKKHNGGASWYAHTGTLSAANPWLPIGSYVRVTNTANGKSVIVRINDRGPFGGGRIIDLDKVAFAKIADLGTGVITVLMEEIK